MSPVWTKSSDEDDNKIQSKQSNDCTDSSTWQAGLVVNATCLKLTIKDGGNNDADGNQNGVIESAIAIANPIIIDDDNNTDSVSSSGGGCVYNPNAPARFDMGFILLMVLSAYYLIRRKTATTDTISIVIIINDNRICYCNGAFNNTVLITISVIVATVFDG
jgi:hypothetical protein